MEDHQRAASPAGRLVVSASHEHVPLWKEDGLEYALIYALVTVLMTNPSVRSPAQGLEEMVSSFSYLG